MPPFIPSTRRRTTPSPPDPSSIRGSLFDAADKPGASGKTLQDNKNFLEKLNTSDDDSALSDISSEEAEKSLLPAPKRLKRNTEEDVEGDNDEEVDWEDAIEHPAASSSRASAGISGDLELTLHENAHSTGSLTNLRDKKKGPSKIEREIRMSTHRMHVQFLLFHNLMRSRWASDKEVQKILVAQLPEQIRVQVDKWRVDSGLAPDNTMPRPKQRISKGKNGKKKSSNDRIQRDWGNPAERQEKGEANMSAGDPIIRLMKFLCVYWKKRFTILAPGLRKEGYKSLAAIEQEIASMRKDQHDPRAHGERIGGIEGFRKAARNCEGSRDIGAQLFTALLRGLGIEARLVASLQPLGFGWGKNEETSAKKEKRSSKSGESNDRDMIVSDDESGDENTSFAKKRPARPKVNRSKKVSEQTRKSRGVKDAPIDLSEDTTTSASESDDQSVVDLTPEIPKRKRNMNYNHDLPNPIYWTEAISPITFQVYPVDALVSKIPIVTSSEYLSQFEPRGAKAEKVKQVFAYIVAYSADGTAKDVTTRYLKRHIWPGRTKGVRMPIEKIPVYNKKGKIKNYYSYDWFKTVMSGYERPHFQRNAVDDLEEEKDLKPAKLEKKEANVREDTLQFYKTSAEFVLERHLRREEAIKPASKPVRTFISGKGDNAKEEPVYRRQDVKVCRTGESWHKEGRAVKPGEHPMKMVPIRAVTLTRKREVEEAERDSGEKQKQGLYAWDQTDWIIPPPIENGRIPKNAYGNIDCFVPTMVPKGAVHIPLRKTVMICKKLGIDYAEAVTGFEFGNKMAVPVIDGVVVAEQHEDLVIDQWEKDEKERKIKEEGKREKMALATWRKWLMGLRIIQRVREEYSGNADAHMKEEMNPFTNQSKARKKKNDEPVPNGKQEYQAELGVDFDEKVAGGFDIDGEVELVEVGGGFLPEGYDEEEVPQNNGTSVIENHMDPPGPLPRGLAALAPKGMDEHSDTDSILTPSHVEETANAELRQPKSQHKSERSEETAYKTATSLKKSSTNGKKRKAISSRDDDDVVDDQPAASNSKTPARSVPKRRAAHKSESAVKSHYFEQQSSEDDDDDDVGDRSDHNAGSENKDADDVQNTARKRRRGRPPGSASASAKKAGRVRKQDVDM